MLIPGYGALDPSRRRKKTGTTGSIKPFGLPSEAMPEDYEYSTASMRDRTNDEYQRVVDALIGAQQGKPKQRDADPNRQLIGVSGAFGGNKRKKLNVDDIDWDE